MSDEPGASRWRRILLGGWHWTRPLKSFAVVYGCLVLVAVFFADRLIFVPPPSTYGEDHPSLHLIDARETEDSRIATFWYPPPDEEAPVLLWTHGNAEDLGTLEPILSIFASQRVGVLGIDYPGYGQSGGSPSEDACYRAIGEGFRFLTQEKGIAADRIVIVGQSVGSGPATWLAEREPEVRGLVLISPFLSAFRAVTRVPLFPGDRFPNARRVQNLSGPLLVIHGEDDGVIPFSQGERLFQLHPGPDKAFVPLPGTGHNDLWSRDFETVLTAMMDLAILKKLPIRGKDS